MHLHNRGDDRSREDTVGEDDDVVEEPRSTGSDERAPVVPEDELIGDVVLDGGLAVQLGVEHPQSETEHGESCVGRAVSLSSTRKEMTGSRGIMEIPKTTRQTVDKLESSPPAAWKTIK